MKTQAMAKAKNARSDCLYPFKPALGNDYPSTRDFDVVPSADGLTMRITARVPFESRVCIAKISGYALSERRLHTLQLSSRIHLYDGWFSGLFPHSCTPNVFLDLHYLEVWTLRDIPVGAPLTRDYASTEDVLFRQFACQCGELNCRGWITGRDEPLNAEGQAFMARWRERKRP
ncbi:MULTISPECIES: SET domain-containing protein [Pseudomonas]|jgi:uncharacterized protein|uniref:SET domain-containing protein n=1 Tax=Pseudomonas rhodesiae TaxID=76760 RepID=A0A8I1JIJ8_9PSED|nr:MULTISPECIES: SET domain-containing protein [Pseudomonas]MBI6605182.1 SET domain-containing protein [Pseudomonas sp. S4_EA_1b]MBI6627366.1 SET domain-containing protein [Pseudomonas rhodesiae]MBX4136795.1 SET domain-containing protein [Pseudomonas sp. S5F11]MDN6863797.1 SET domain-containing protein [Pseudomonas rhodesiae]NMY81688.1 SET domain-containing protein [Pseudomonas rhodesiae]